MQSVVVVVVVEALYYKLEDREFDFRLDWIFQFT
jgi:hypothetical protein